ncbi:MAG: serine aminopeptidase domain-containing protein, partial [Gammaproteobacteria bacterium]
MVPSNVTLFVTLAGVLLGGCMVEQRVSIPYPRWGEEYTLESAENRPTSLTLRLLASSSTSPGAKGCLLLVHGMNEYIGRYREIAEYFSSDFRVAGFDLFAHGLSNPLIERADWELAHGATEADVSRAFIAQASLYELDPLRHD